MLSVEKSNVWADVPERTSSWSSDENKLVESSSESTCC